MASTSAPRRRTRPVRENMREFGVWAFESQHGDRFRMGPTIHRFTKLLLIREGSGRLQCDAHNHGCKAGDLVVVAAGERHWLVDDVGGAISLLGLGVSSKLLSVVPGLNPTFVTEVLGPEQTSSLNLEQRMRRLQYLAGQSDQARQLACVGGALELYAELMIVLSANREARQPTRNRLRQNSPVQPMASHQQGEMAPVSPLLQSYLVWLQDHFYEDLSLDHAAQVCQMSRRHFTACFRHATGTSWLEHVHRLRVCYAVKLLQQGDRKIASIAFASGFRDLTTFYRVMARMTGKRPADFRLVDQELTHGT